MKLKLVVMMCVALAVPLYLAGCSPRAPVPIQLSDSTQRFVDCDTFSETEIVYEEVEISLDDTLTVVLCSNPTTGFQWLETARISNPGTIIQTDHTFIEPDDENPVLPGAAGMEQWTFQPVNKGMTFVYMDYSQPWEGGEEKAWTYTLLVTVK
jgi:inhibitor of cysteine peptidase